jgi:starch synthase
MSPDLLSPPPPSQVALTPARHVTRSSRARRPVILLVTPELSESRFLGRNGKDAPRVKAGGLADISALLLDSLADQGMDAHIAIPHYSKLIGGALGGRSRNLHFCEDGEFEHRRSVYDCENGGNVRAALAFQRHVIRHVIPTIRPDVVHCHDWMTGLIPAAAGAMGISSLFTIHNLHDADTTLVEIEDAGIDAHSLWQRLFFNQFPYTYESSRENNHISLLASGIHSADETNTVSPGFLEELCDGVHGSQEIGTALRTKASLGRAHGILNSLPANLLPQHDPFLVDGYDAATHREGKRVNKAALQLSFGLEQNLDAPLIFWPSRLEPHQKGCGLLAEILRQTIVDYWGPALQFVFVADGPGRERIEEIVAGCGLERRVAIRHFSERESRMGYAASDFTLMPSSYEPCGLSQMIALRYGSIPVVHSTGGLRDTITPLNRDGNGILFENHDRGGLRWAIDEAMRFHALPYGEREARIAILMRNAAVSYQSKDMVSRYLELYERILKRR